MTKRITHIAKPLLPATLTLSALMSMAACGSTVAKPSAAAAGTNTTAVSAPGTSQPGGAPSISQPAAPAAPTETQTPAQPSNQIQTSTQAQAPAAPKTSANAAKPASKPSTTSDDSGADLPGDCAVGHLKGTVTSLTRPVNHVLLTVTNTGSTTCNLYYYPGLRLDADQQSVTQAVEDSKPQAVVTIAPGESAYAAIGTSAADGSGGTPVLEKQVEVFLETRDQSGSLPGSMTLPLPGGTYVDMDKAFVTYWQSDLQSAIAW
ncbi:hypothetical protein ABIA35_004064 [Catenulispora sp. MAP12-49]|uniref:DUF4232 domain-containing protein n=1 Tax=Catenulispora sp. MAP12-49 TaxID=3156302 RepID=UPI003519A558